MPIDPKHLARTILDAAYAAADNTEIKLDLASWSGQQVQALLDSIIDNLNIYKLRLNGVRTDNSTFAKLGIDRDVTNGGKYKGVPVVIAITVDFDNIEFVFRPQA